MPLPPSQHQRDKIHTRSVQCIGYRRADGLWDIEGHLTDIKTYSFENEHRGTIKAGDPLHEMWIRLTVTDELEVRAVEAVTDNAPFGICPSITPEFQKIVGLKIAPGWNKAIQERVGGVHGCTHLFDLLKAIATTAFQTIIPIINRERNEAKGLSSGDNPPVLGKAGQRPGLINSCHAFSESGDLVKKRWPEWYKPSTDTQPDS